MKIALITLHDTDNCGSSLQAFALQHYLLSIGHDCEIIDYVPSYTKNNGRPIKNFLKKCIYFKDKKNQDISFKKFKNSFMKLSDLKYKTFEDLRQRPPIADIYMTGSDQLWNTYFKCGKDDAYYLKFINNVKKVSYAVSLGRNNYTNEEIKGLIEKTKDYDKITVRELSSMEILKINNRIDAEHVCDPTLLLERSVYEEIKIDLLKEPYVFIYLTLESDLLDLTILKIKKIYPNHKIVYYGSFKPHCHCDIHIRTAGPQEFLGLIYNASYVIAGSFHATIFSIIFRKNFIILPSKNNERMIQLLEMLDLEKNYITYETDLSFISNNIDYNHIYEILDKHVDSSKKVLMEMCNENK
ncbi:polysaccharide pyruvyl transferase family protein [[Eubacterium] hominis]|uniref:polysaccharide pyruvyl transferase family protein n=1 Tax=[Eubacterium] hominis TaxID=2764325 RepID=UPI003A4E4C77